MLHPRAHPQPIRHFSIPHVSLVAFTAFLCIEQLPFKPPSVSTNLFGKEGDHLWLFPSVASLLVPFIDIKLVGIRKKFTQIQLKSICTFASVALCYSRAVISFLCKLQREIHLWRRASRSSWWIFYDILFVIFSAFWMRRRVCSEVFAVCLVLGSWNFLCLTSAACETPQSLIT